MGKDLMVARDGGYGIRITPNYHKYLGVNLEYCHNFMEKQIDISFVYP